MVCTRIFCVCVDNLSLRRIYISFTMDLLFLYISATIRKSFSCMIEAQNKEVRNMEEQERQYAQAVRAEYAPKSEETNRLEQLKALDGAVRRPAAIFAYTFGILGALVLGVGMCLAMEVIGSLMPLGIVIGVIGIVMVAVNYPIYKRILSQRKKKYAPEIVALSDELLNH